MKYKVFNTLLDGVVIVDDEMNIVYANEAMETITDIPVKRFKPGKPFSDFVTFGAPLFDGSIEEIKSSTPYKELPFKTKNGKEGVLQITMQPEDDEENLGRWIIFFKDVSLEAQLHSKYHNERKEKEQAIENSHLDPLTNINNKRAFMEKYESMFEKAKNGRFTFCLVVFDLDNFKSVNDNYGHAAGDYVLVTLADIVKNQVLREYDFFARFGGEEFVILLSRISIDLAENVCERVRAAIADYEFVYNGQKLPVTVSVGVGEYSSKFATSQEFFETVDHASYESKKKGKNAVSLAA